MTQQQIVAELAPHGVLRAAINMGNFLLVTGRTPSGDPDGCSPDMARAIAASLGVPVQFVPYAKPGELADDAENDKWDIGNIGAEPSRAEKIEFTAAYVEIEATYLVPAGSPIKSIAEVDVKGNRIAVTARSAYDLWLDRGIKHATLIRGNPKFRQRALHADGPRRQIDSPDIRGHASGQPLTRRAAWQIHALQRIEDGFGWAFQHRAF